MKMPPRSTDVHHGSGEEVSAINQTVEAPHDPEARKAFYNRVPETQSSGGIN